MYKLNGRCLNCNEMDTIVVTFVDHRDNRYECANCGSEVKPKVTFDWVPVEKKEGQSKE